MGDGIGGMGPPGRLARRSAPAATVALSDLGDIVAATPSSAHHEALVASCLLLDLAARLPIRGRAPDEASMTYLSYHTFSITYKVENGSPLLPLWPKILHHCAVKLEQRNNQIAFFNRAFSR